MENLPQYMRTWLVSVHKSYQWQILASKAKEGFSSDAIISVTIMDGAVLHKWLSRRKTLGKYEAVFWLGLNSFIACLFVALIWGHRKEAQIDRKLAKLQRGRTVLPTGEGERCSECGN
jgi:hypothetical protein